MIFLLFSMRNGLRKKAARGSGAFGSDFRIVFGKELHGTTILRIHGVGQETCGKRQPLDWAGLGLGLAGLRPKEEAGGSGGFRSNFRIVLHKEL